MLQSLSRTYQEAVLARRRLYFTNTRMYMECEQGIFHEDEFNNTAMLTRPNFASTHNPTQLRHPGYGTDFDAYVDHVKYYSFRFLSFPSDVYAAFSGILAALFGSDSLHYGLPLANFDCALHWCVVQSYQTETSLEANSKGAFPSWSWYSQWNPSSMIDHEILGFCGTLCIWYSHDDTRDILSVLNKQSESLLHVDWRFYMAIACEAGCVMGSSNLPPAQETEFDIGTGSGNHWLDYPEFCHRVGAFIVDILPEVRRIMRETPTAILGHLQSTFFDLEDVSGPQQLGWRIVDSQGGTVGYLSDYYPGLIIPWESQNTSSAKVHRRFEFVGTMLRVPDWPPGDTREIWLAKAYFQGNETYQIPVPLVSVMLIAWDGPVAYRRALGWVYLKDWIAAPRTWKTIILK
jgi:hypothetical protein